MSICRSLSLPTKSFRRSAFLLTVFQHSAPRRCNDPRSLTGCGLADSNHQGNEDSSEHCPASFTVQTQTTLFTRRQVSLHDPCSPQRFQERLPSLLGLLAKIKCRKDSHIPRALAADDGQTSPSIILLYVFKIILCNAPRMSELLCELTSLHIFQLISGN